MRSSHLILCHPLFLLPSTFPSIRSFPMNWLFSTGVQSIGVVASASVLPMNIEGWFPLGLTGLISLLSKWLPRIFSSTTVWKHQFFSSQCSCWSNSHIHNMTTGKTIALTIRTFGGKVMSLLFNTLSRFVIASLPRSKCLLILATVPHWVEISVSQFTCSVLSDSFQPRGLQHARPPCLLPTPRVYSDSCPLSQWCHTTISSSVIPFSSCLQFSPTSGSIHMS